jgi:hypothetical protein
MRGSDMASSVHAPSHAIPHLGQFTDDGSEGSTSINGEQTPDVLSQYPNGLYLAYDAKHLSPEETAVTSPLALSSNAEGLARETTGEKVDCLRTSGWFPSILCILPSGVPAASSFADGVGHSLTVERSDIVVNGYSWKVFGENLLAELVLLHQCNGLESGPACSQIQTSDTGKE